MAKYYRMYTAHNYFHVTASDDQTIFEAIDAVESHSGQMVSGGYSTRRTQPKPYEASLTIGT